MTAPKKPPASRAPSKAKAVKPKQAAKVPTIAERIHAFGIDAICEHLSDGTTMTLIAETVGVSVGKLSQWIASTPEHSARAREARIHAARIWDEKALTVIEDAGDQFELHRARELAQHYRWRASKTAPKDYGDKIAVGGADDLPPIQTRAMTDAERAVRMSRMLNDSPELLAGLLSAIQGKKP